MLTTTLHRSDSDLTAALDKRRDARNSQRDGEVAR